MFQGTRNGFSRDGEWYGEYENARLFHGGLEMASRRNFGMLQAVFFVSAWFSLGARQAVRTEPFRIQKTKNIVKQREGTQPLSFED